MKWNNEQGYILYKSSLNNIKTLLSISQIDFYTNKKEIAPYITYILNYINKRLILLGDEVDIITKIQEVINIYETGSDKIICGAVRDLILEIGIDEGDIYVENQEIPYNQDRFIYSWTNLLTALVTRIRLQYSQLLSPIIDQNCPCPDCSPGQTTEDFESWTSKIFPEDENYLEYNKSEGWHSETTPPICTKNFRRL